MACPFGTVAVLMVDRDLALGRDDMIDRLRAAGCVFAEEEADILMRSASDASALEAMVASRLRGEPLEHVVGWAKFAGMRILVGPGVFVPRRRTEFLVSLTLAEVSTGSTVVDVCCGSGAIAAAIAGHRPGVELFAVDIDAVAVDCARRNLDGLATVLCGDLDEPLPDRLLGRVDVMVANAPYVPTDALEFLPREARDHEPLVTLDGGADGLAVQRRIAETAPRWLRNGGRLLIETSDVQAPLTVEACVANGFSARAVTSEADDATVVVGVWRHESP
jgi:release factor glutamine methyltransferase